MHQRTPLVLKRTLGQRQLTLLGIGAIVGAGIFVVTGQAAATHAGPGLAISFALAALACTLTGLCYAEMAAAFPQAGSAYVYARASMGERMGWFVGWNLIMEYLFAVAMVAASWSGYLRAALTALGLPWFFNGAWSTSPIAVTAGHLELSGAVMNLPAAFIVIALAYLCHIGVSRSSGMNAIMVTIKLSVIVLFVVGAASVIDARNWHPFIPPNVGPGQFGWSGVFRGAAMVFLAFIGFDAISTGAAEATNPQRDLPRALLTAIAVCTLLYIAMVLALTGMVPYPQLNTAQPVTTALNHFPQLLWLERPVALGALVGLTSVILVMLQGLTRILWSMARDRLIPGMFGNVHPRFRTPTIATAATGVIGALLAAYFPTQLLGDLLSMGTLLAFACVSLGTLRLRYTQPALVRPFRVRALWPVSLGASTICLYLFWQIFTEHAWLLIGWAVAGQMIFMLMRWRASLNPSAHVSSGE